MSPIFRSENKHKLTLYKEDRLDKMEHLKKEEEAKLQVVPICNAAFTCTYV